MENDVPLLLPLPRDAPRIISTDQLELDAYKDSQKPNRHSQFHGVHG